ncbi:MAG: N-acetylmuramic acid 6-phosphate etherase [Acidobacteria bacterium]|nr:N-acetylmuramic acid 6-phosphate etherase [Acidobacteriota bacterium]
MPISYIDVPPGIRVDAKKKLVKEVYTALDEAYRVPDTRIFLREWSLENVSQDGRLDLEPAKPVVFLEVPPGIHTDVKRTMVKRISTAIAEAYRLPDILIFIREYPLDMVSQDGGLQSENPMILEAVEKAGLSAG